MIWARSAKAEFAPEGRRAKTPAGADADRRRSVTDPLPHRNQRPQHRRAAITLRFDQPVRFLRGSGFCLSADPSIDPPAHAEFLSSSNAGSDGRRDAPGRRRRSEQTGGEGRPKFPQGSRMKKGLPVSGNFSITQGTALATAARSRMRSGSGAMSPCAPMRSPK